MDAVQVRNRLNFKNTQLNLALLRQSLLGAACAESWAEAGVQRKSRSRLPTRLTVALGFDAFCMREAGISSQSLANLT